MCRLSAAVLAPKAAVRAVMRKRARFLYGVINQGIHWRENWAQDMAHQRLAFEVVPDAGAVAPA